MGRHRSQISWRSMDGNQLDGVRRAADARTDDVEAQIAAAFACDAEGLEAEAAVFYDRAWRLGVPHDQRHDFLVGYGSTLRIVGRLDESIEILEIAADEFPGDLAPLAFLALTLNGAGQHDASVGLLLECLVTGDGPGVARFSRALRSYAALLRG